MTKHYLKAYIGGMVRGSGFRIVCEDPEACGSEQNYGNKCIFVDQFESFGLSMVNWPAQEIHMGTLEVKADSWFTPVPEASPPLESKRHGDETTWPADQAG